MNMRAIAPKILALALAALAACGGATGGSEVGNPPASLRQVNGSVPDGQAALVKSLTGNCAADRVLATDTSAQVTLVEVEEDCTFSLRLAVNRAYSIAFTLGDTFVANMLFNNGADFLSSPVFYVSSGSAAIDLGAVTFSGRVGRPANEPARQNDRDDDDIDDYEDEDDDNDGRDDRDEDDCDLDGFIGDDDEDDGECATDGDGERVLQVNPRHDPEFENPVDLEREIEIRFSCEVDESLINASRITVESEDGHEVECEFETSGSEITCSHEDDPFVAGAVYTATVDGLECVGGEGIAAKTWTFRAEEED